MNKLMSSLIAATIVGAFSMSAIAADAAKATPATGAAEKPAAAPKKAQSTKKHTVKAEEKKSDAAAMPAEPAKK
jgi:ribosomal protein L12E/L44/L45/RPP1/RPP2